MEPLSLTAGAIATFILIGLANGALQRTGEIVMDKLLDRSEKLKQLLKDRFPDTAGAIEIAAQRPELAQQQPLDYGEAVLVEKVEQAANADPEIKAAIEDLAATQENPQVAEVVKTVIENWQGINIKGGINTINQPNLIFGSK